MNMMSVLLGATGLLLVAALVLSFGSMNKDLGTSPTKKEVAALRTELEVLRAAEAELRLLRQQKETANAMAGTSAYVPQSNPVTNTPASVAVANEEAESAAEIAALKQELADAQEEAARQEKRAETLSDEVGVAWEQKIEKTDSERRRDKLIRAALLIATVTEWSPDDGFLVIDINRPESVQEGTVLAIRRDGGIIGRVKVATLYPEGASADPLPGTFFGGNIDIQAGDELITPMD